MSTININNELRNALLATGETAIAVEMNNLPSIVVKVSRVDALSFKRPGVTVLYRPELGLYPTGAVFRLYCEFHDPVGSGYYGFETFLNPAAQPDVLLLRLFAVTPPLDFHILDMRLRYVFTKRISVSEQTRTDLTLMILQARAHNASLPRLDYSASLAEMQADTAV